MYSTRIAAIFAILLVCRAYGRPDKIAEDKEGEDDGYFGDDTERDYDEETETDPDNESNGTPAEPPEIKTKPLMIEVRPGSNVELPCYVVNGDDFAVEWKKGNVSLFFGDSDMIKDTRIVTTANHSLIIYNVTKSDSSDSYSCVLLADSQLEVIHAVHVVDKSTDRKDDDKRIRVIPSKKVEVDENQSTTFGCETRDPTVKIIWSHKGSKLQHGEEIQKNGKYVAIKQANRHHGGRYQCLADVANEEHPPYEFIDVIVKFKPVIEAEHDIVHTGLGLTSELTCKVHAHPRAKVTWMKNGKQVSGKKDKKLHPEDKSSRVLVIEHTEEHDLGAYTCVASNPMGEATKEIILTGNPAKPKFVGIDNKDDEKTVVFKWKVKSYAPIKEYKLEYRRKGEGEWISESPDVKDGDRNEFMVEHALKDLQPGVSYETKLLAKNDFGWSSSSDTHYFKIEYISEPQNVTGYSSASSTRSLAALSVLLVFLSYISTNI
ncbi:neural cell adhesion molecule 1-B-like isoform X1 [Microplitis mediator]|uniref:neural cell adhesion molecule 1-B-like isoform X1 n=2 Tax=Microplitis mediator TaxID=375433 RepID=UPI002553C392|nr:neural cell adhesion molecule 1-B-like isoform X1 [Microplitis mediator]